MKTPGLESENKVKAQAAHELESMGDTVKAKSNGSENL